MERERERERTQLRLLGLLCTLQNSPHTHTSTKMWAAANAARVMEGLFAKILLRQAAAFFLHL